MTLRAARVAALLFLPGLAGCGRARVSPSTARAPDGGARASASFLARVDSLRRAHGIPGLAVVVLRDTTVILARGLGVADLETGRPVTPDTPFDIASVSKPVSAVVALRLVESGHLDLDRPMQRYERFAGYCTAVRAEGGIFFGDYACEGDRLTMRHVLAMTANGDAPGTRFWYNPPAFSWASRPMAEVAGRPFSHLVDSLVFRPAGMRDAARRHRALALPADLAARLALPHGVDSAGRMVRTTPPPPQGDGAAGGVIASAMDLARFDVALEAGRLLTPASRAALFTGTRTPAGATLPYGLGFYLGALDGRPVAWHTGLWEGRYSALYLKVRSDVPGERLTLVLLANSDGLTWPGRFDEAAIERSAFARAFVEAFPAGRRASAAALRADTAAPLADTAALRVVASGIFAAIARADSAALAPLLADELRWVVGSGNVAGRSQLLGAASRSAPMVTLEYEIDSLRTWVHGDVATAEYRLTNRRTFREYRPMFVSRASDVLVRRAGRWQLVAHTQAWIVRPPATIALDSMALAAFVGRYDRGSGYIDDVHFLDGHLVAQSTYEALVDAPGAHLLPVSANTFSPEGSAQMIVFERDGCGRVTGYVQQGPDGVITRARRMGARQDEGRARRPG